MQQTIVTLIHRHAWLALAALVIGVLVWAAKQPFAGSLLTRISPPNRARVVVGLGLASGVVDAIMNGTPWLDALIGGLLAGGAAAIVHDASPSGLTPAASNTPQEQLMVDPALQTLRDADGRPIAAQAAPGSPAAPTKSMAPAASRDAVPRPPLAGGAG